MYITFKYNVTSFPKRKMTFRYIAFLPRPSFPHFLYVALGRFYATVNSGEPGLIKNTRDTSFTAFKHLRSWNTWRRNDIERYFRSTQHKNQSVILCAFVTSSRFKEGRRKKCINIIWESWMLDDYNICNTACNKIFSC